MNPIQYFFLCNEICPRCGRAHMHRLNQLCDVTVTVLFRVKIHTWYASIHTWYAPSLNWLFGTWLMTGLSWHSVRLQVKHGAGFSVSDPGSALVMAKHNRCSEVRPIHTLRKLRIRLECFTRLIHWFRLYFYMKLGGCRLRMTDRNGRNWHT